MATTNSPVANYPIVPALVDPDGKLSNYSVTTNTATGTINPASLTISAVSDTKTYDGTTSSSQTPTYQVTGLTANTLFSGDSFSSLSEAFASKNALGANNSLPTG